MVNTKARHDLDNALVYPCAYISKRIEGALLLRRPPSLEASHDGIQGPLRHERKSILLQR